MIPARRRRLVRHLYWRGVRVALFAFCCGWVALVVVVGRAAFERLAPEAQHSSLIAERR